MYRWTRGGPLVAAICLSCVTLACDDGTTEPPPEDEILRFDVTLTGFVVLASGDTITFEGVTGEINVAPPFDLASANGANEVDVGVFTTDTPAAGVTGVRFQTNTILTGPNTVGASGEDVADVVTFGNQADVEATLITAAVGATCTTPPPDNIFSSDAVYKMVTGQVFLSLPPGTITGTIAFGGNPCDGSSEASTIFSATVAGNRIQ